VGLVQGAHQGPEQVEDEAHADSIGTWGHPPPGSGTDCRIHPARTHPAARPSTPAWGRRTAPARASGAQTRCAPISPTCCR